MKKFTVRPAEPKDAENYVEWLSDASDINLVDYGVYSAPTCNTLVVDKNDSPVLMNSVQAVLVMEALAPRPGVSKLDEAKALKELFDGIKRIAAASGIREVWFGCKDESLAQFIENRDFKRLSFPVFRYKLPL